MDAVLYHMGSCTCGEAGCCQLGQSYVSAEDYAEVAYERDALRAVVQSILELATPQPSPLPWDSAFPGDQTPTAPYSGTLDRIAELARTIVEHEDNGGSSNW